MTVLTRKLEVTKTSDATVDSRPGDTITYTVTAKNTGGGDFTADNPARVVDDLTGVLDDATFNNDAAADVGNDPSYSSPRLLWTGALPAGETVTITYTVTLKGGGDGNVDNVAWAPAVGDPPGPTPDCDAPRPRCRAPRSSRPPQALDLEDVQPLRPAGRRPEARLHGDGQERGTGHLPAASPATFTDDLSEVLDDADFDAGSITASPGAASFDPATGELTWTGALAAGASATITYSVTYDEDKDGDQQLDNAACIPEDEALTPSEDCITVRVPGSGLDQTKRSTPASGTPVDAGDVVTYTLRFTNTGPAPATVDAFDDVSGVVDDATLGTISAETGLTAVLDPNGGQPRIHVTGTCRPGRP